MPVSRILTHESRNPRRSVAARRSVFSASRTSLAFGAVALATALTLVGAPAAEALGLF